MKPLLTAVLASTLLIFLSAQTHTLSAQTHSPLPSGPAPGPSISETNRLIDSLEGPALYKAYCAVCHGIDAKGTGPLAIALKTPPSNLTRIAARNGGVYPTAKVERIIAGEEQIPGGHGTGTMPVWGPIFSQIAWDQDLGRVRIHNLATYIGKIQVR
jgi:mono/diheme cytochrome c family protein